MGGDFLDFDGAAAAKFGLGNFDAAFDRGGIVAVGPIVDVFRRLTARQRRCIGIAVAVGVGVGVKG